MNGNLLVISVIIIIVLVFALDFMKHRYKQDKKNYMKRRKKKRKRKKKMKKKQKMKRNLDKMREYEMDMKLEREMMEDIKRKKKKKEKKINKNIVFLDIMYGDAKLIKVVIKLFSDIVPKTCENFRKLCTSRHVNSRDGTYRNSVFHRVIKGFMIQGGDITNGDGTGGYSIYGKKFPDENFKIRHDSAGLLSMANSGRNTNGSQFFITLAPQEHLDGNHVVFGKVIKGMDHVRDMGQINTINSKPRKEVRIVNCGFYDGKL